tara:strand:- start:38 stop:547 length:510 start_codon:yes stop_codon:yes gene_type:complete
MNESIINQRSHTNHSKLRACFLGDIENLAGRKEGPTHLDVISIAEAVYKTFGMYSVFPVVATAHCNAEPVWFNWPGARKLVKSGVDGADLKLLEVMKNEDLAKRFDLVIIGSCDHIFSEAASKLASQGVRVVAALGRGRISKRLRMAVHDVVRLPIDFYTDEEEVRISA